MGNIKKIFIGLIISILMWLLIIGIIKEYTDLYVIILIGLFIQIILLLLMKRKKKQKINIDNFPKYFANALKEANEILFSDEKTTKDSSSVNIGNSEKVKNLVICPSCGSLIKDNIINNNGKYICPYCNCDL